MELPDPVPVIRLWVNDQSADMYARLTRSVLPRDEIKRMLTGKNPVRSSRKKRFKIVINGLKFFLIHARKGGRGDYKLVACIPAEKTP